MNFLSYTISCNGPCNVCAGHVLSLTPFLPYLKFQFPLTLSQMPTKPVDLVFWFHVPLSKKFNDRILSAEHHMHWPEFELSWLAPIAPKRIISEGFSRRPTWLDILSNKVVSKALRSSATSDWDSGSPLIIIFHLLLWRSLLSWCTLWYPVSIIADCSLRFISDTASELFWWASCTSLGLTSLTSFFITSESWFSMVDGRLPNRSDSRFRFDVLVYPNRFKWSGTFRT